MKLAVKLLLSNWDVNENEFSENDLASLSKQTLAYFLADKNKREQIQELFKLLVDNISIRITEVNRRKAFGKTLYGVNDAIEIEAWTQENVDKLLAARNREELFNIAWPLITKYINNRTFKVFNKKDVLEDIVKKWILGAQYYELFQIADNNNCRLGRGNQPRKVKIEHVVDICEGGIAYDSTLVVSALCEFLEMLDLEGVNDLITRLQLFQKCLKYGLPSETTILIYELGFSDRVISQDLVTSIGLKAAHKKELLTALKQNEDVAISVIEKYPSYFQERMKSVLQGQC